MTRDRTAAGLRAALVGAMIALLALVGLGAPAYAHSGNAAVVLVRNLTLTPVATGWEAHLTLADLDSGSPIIAADAKLTPGAAAPVALEPSGNSDGLYAAKLPTLKPGVLALRLVIRTAPGSPPVAVFDRTYPATTLTAGQETVVTAAASGGGGGSNTGMIVGVAGAVLLVALLYGLFTIRRRGALPARAE
jgi:hypothetical protein